MRKEDSDICPLYGEDILTATGKKNVGWGQERFNDWDLFARHDRSTARLTQLIIGAEFLGSSYFMEGYRRYPEEPALLVFGLRGFGLTALTIGLIGTAISDYGQKLTCPFKNS